MSVSLQEVLESAGYDIKNNVDDAIWLLSKQNEFEELIEECEDFVDSQEDEDDYDEWGRSSIWRCTQRLWI